MKQNKPITELCTHNLTDLYYRDANLVEELLGKKTFTEVMFQQITGRAPAASDLRIVDAVMITLMEHGFTPSAIAARLVYMSAPENLQGAVASGLLAVGSSFVGTMENCAKLLHEIMNDPNGPEAAAERIASSHRARRASMPGFGHHLHKPDDPRAIKLLEIADGLPDIKGEHVAALRTLARAVDAAAGRHITINATGAIAALLGEIGIPWQVMRGFAVISRAAGLVSHIAEEQKHPSGRYIWDLVDHDIPYVGKGEGLNKQSTGGES
ncbi:citryl-CoA lyase [Noviherbaspirillum malthae]|jgi:citrate synthase|uniref:citryl-CoA lyase n=1 Tax=Noviherbaspirillum malthae TaxID=1260987 RepID=UPI00188F15EE|nr:citryl-CoA lyase [Noviherbaspirillum malthae]